MGVDWVHERGECHIRKAFEELRQVVEKDVEKVNALDRPGIGFKFSPAQDNAFVVTRDSGMLGNDTVGIIFRLSGNEIEVHRNGIDNPHATVSVQWNSDLRMCSYIYSEFDLHTALYGLSDVSERALAAYFFP